MVFQLNMRFYFSLLLSWWLFSSWLCSWWLLSWWSWASICDMHSSIIGKLIYRPCLKKTFLKMITTVLNYLLSSFSKIVLQKDIWQTCFDTLIFSKKVSCVIKIIVKKMNIQYFELRSQMIQQMYKDSQVLRPIRLSQEFWREICQK